MHLVLMITLGIQPLQLLLDENGEYPVPAPGVYRPFA